MTEEEIVKPIYVPVVIAQAMEAGAALAVSISGGKDSQAMLLALTRLHRQQRWPGAIYAVHAHLGRAEWPQTLEHCRRIAEAAGIELVVVSRPQGDLITEMRQRMAALAGTGKPHWPDARNRYCTADQKRGQIDRVLRAPHWPDARNRYCTAHQKTNQIDREHRRHEVVISAMGMRAEESPARARKPVVSVRASITSEALKGASPDVALSDRQPGQRVALDWLPLHEWTEDEVFRAFGSSLDDVNRRRELYRLGRVEEALEGWPGHPAYVFGNQRLSCALCVLASRNDLWNGIRHCPDIYQEYVAMERESGFSFRQDLGLETVEIVAAQERLF